MGNFHIDLFYPWPLTRQRSPILALPLLLASTPRPPPQIVSFPFMTYIPSPSLVPHYSPFRPLSYNILSTFRFNTHMYACISHLHVISVVKKSTWNLSFWVWLISLNIIFSSSIHFLQLLFHSVTLQLNKISHFLHFFICWWTSRLIPYCEQYILNRCRCANICVVKWPRIFWLYNFLIYIGLSIARS